MRAIINVLNFNVISDHIPKCISYTIRDKLQRQIILYIATDFATIRLIQSF